MGLGNQVPKVSRHHWYPPLRPARNRSLMLRSASSYRWATSPRDVARYSIVAQRRRSRKTPTPSAARAGAALTAPPGTEWAPASASPTCSRRWSWPRRCSARRRSRWEFACNSPGSTMTAAHSSGVMCSSSTRALSPTASSPAAHRDSHEPHVLVVHLNQAGRSGQVSGNACRPRGAILNRLGELLRGVSLPCQRDRLAQLEDPLIHLGAHRRYCCCRSHSATSLSSRATHLLRGLGLRSRAATVGTPMATARCADRRCGRSVRWGKAAAW